MNYEQETRVDGISACKYFAHLLEEFENGRTEIAKAQVEIGYMRQVNRAHNHALRAMINGIY